MERTAEVIRSPKTRRVLILADFLRPDSVWLDDFCPRSDFEFKKEPYVSASRSWHARGAVTPLREWLAHLWYVLHALRETPDCIITCFPQMALVAAAVLRVTARRSTRLIAWNFNLGSLSSPWKGRIAGRLLSRVDRFVVHASAEIVSYARWLQLSEEKFRFVPLQRGRIEPKGRSPIDQPYVVSMGSANRDYGTLVNAVLGTGIKTVIIAKKSITDQLPDHPDLVKLHGLTMEECNRILSGATVNVVPIASSDTASGQITFTTGMRLGVATVASQCVGTADYLEDGITGILVPPRNPEALGRAIQTLWNDDGLRSRIAAAGRLQADSHFSDEAVAKRLAELIDQIMTNGRLEVLSNQRREQ